MFTWLVKAFSLLKGLFDLWGYWMQYRVDAEIAERERVKQEREKAIEDSKKAETETEIWDSQEEIVKNQPKP